MGTTTLESLNDFLLAQSLEGLSNVLLATANGLGDLLRGEVACRLAEFLDDFAL